MKLTPTQLTDLTSLAQNLSRVIADAENLNITAREISLAKTKLEEAELWLERFITGTPEVQTDLKLHNFNA